jgi:hypothetical protein
MIDVAPSRLSWAACARGRGPWEVERPGAIRPFGIVSSGSRNPLSLRAYTPAAAGEVSGTSGSWAPVAGAAGACSSCGEGDCCIRFR